MAVLAMKKVNICALKKDRKAVLETLQRLGMVEISDLCEAQQSGFRKIDTFSMLGFDFLIKIRPLRKMHWKFWRNMSPKRSRF